MNLHNELSINHIPHNCTQCCVKNCSKSRYGVCDSFHPDDVEDFIEYNMMDYLRSINIPSQKSRIEKKSAFDETNPVKYDRNRNHINSILSSIRCTDRKNPIDHAYHIYTIKQLLAFEPNLKVTYLPEDECFEVRL